jgi:hypothetical protein
LTTVSTTVESTIAAPREPFFTWLVPGVFFDELHTVLRDAAFMPGVEKTTDTTGPWDVPGSNRIVHTTDGAQVRETVTAAVAPDYFSYRVNEFSSPLIKRLVSEARGQWWFSSEGDRTHAKWTYSFDTRGIWAVPILFPMVKLLWKRYMRAAMNVTKQRAEVEVKAVSQ